MKPTIKNGRYYVIFWERCEDGTRKKRWKGLSRVKEGKEALRKALAVYRTPAPQKHEPNFTRWMRAYRLTYQKRGLSPEVLYNYNYQYGVLEESFGHLDVEKISAGMVLTWLLTHYGDKPHMAQVYRSRLNMFFDWLVLNDDCHLKVNPCWALKRKLPETPTREARMSAEVFWRIHAKMPEIGRIFMELMHHTSQRPTEIRKLRESQIFDGLIHFTPTKTKKKTGEKVDVVITPAIQRVLDRARSHRAGLKVMSLQHRDFVLLSDKGLPFTDETLWYVWDRARTAAGLPKGKEAGITTRDMRNYSLSTAMKKGGASIEEARKRAAHTKTQMTEHYTRPYREVVSDLDVPLPDKPPEFDN